MYITNVGDLVEEMKPRLREYLVKKLGPQAQSNKFCCYVHNESTPSMVYNPKDGYTTVHCFGCGANHDIFAACAHLENLPATGPGWITEMIPHLAEVLELEVELGEISAADKERAKMYRITADIAAIIEANSSKVEKYCRERGWSQDHLTIGSASVEEIKSKLVENGWDYQDIALSPYFINNATYFGEDMVTFVIRDYRSRPIGFSSRNLKYTDDKANGPKYKNTPETILYKKSRVLFGLDAAIRDAKDKGVYVVEGQGDVAALHAQGIMNAVATCGTAFTSEHLDLLKQLNIRNAKFCLDWDEPGQKATMRILEEEVQLAPGVSIWVVEAPKSGEKDAGQFLENHDGEAFTKLPLVGGFLWMIDRLKGQYETAELCEKVIPLIASEPAGIRRELLARDLSELTGISTQSILSDVNYIRDGKYQERIDRIQAVTNRFHKKVQADPDELQAYVAEMEQEIENINAEYDKDSIGVNYQLSRFDALQQERQQDSGSSIGSYFKLSKFTYFMQALSNGMRWTSGVVMYVGGRANSGKTAIVIGIATDIAMTDENAVVIMHFTDDAYDQVEPRIKSNIASMLHEQDDPELPIVCFDNPYENIKTAAEWRVHHRANEKFRDLLAQERLVFIDSSDGSTLAALEKQLRHIRNNFPGKRIFIACDNTHNYTSFQGQGATEQMKAIATEQKRLVGKYKACMMATVEYTKSQLPKSKKDDILWPEDNDIADARAMIYRPNFIMHVYNDLNDRPDTAEIMWKKKGVAKAMPRLILAVTKNKISGFKNKLAADLDTQTVTVRQVDKEKARSQADMVHVAKETNQIQYGQDGITLTADWEE